jgi:hypothetical protein
MLLLAWGPAAGYYSATKYNLIGARAYLGFYCLKVSLRRKREHVLQKYIAANPEADKRLVDR